MALFRTIAKGIGYLIGLVFVAAIGLAGYRWLDEKGYLPHDKMVDVATTTDWPLGENRMCWLDLKPDANGDKTDYLLCLAGEEKALPPGMTVAEPHNVPVRFKGVIDPVDMVGKPRVVADQWQCTRESDKLTCVPGV